MRSRRECARRLETVHKPQSALDRAVLAAYGWDERTPEETTDEEILTRVLALNGERTTTSD